MAIPKPASPAGHRAGVGDGHPPDYVDAHCRHWEDGNLLRNHRRWANAAYLLGFSAECGLKAVMQALGWMRLDDAGKPAESKHRKHIQAIWPLFADLARGAPGAKYKIDLGNPFRDWSHHDRYSNRNHACPDVVSRYRDATKDVGRIVDLARLDGTL